MPDYCLLSVSKSLMILKKNLITMDFLQYYGEAILTMSIIIILIFLTWSKIFKETNYNGKGMFEEGYTKAEKEIKKGKDATVLFNQCPGADDAWDRGWVQACSDYRKSTSEKD